ncbi:hypothetical protein DB346_14390 [Verrucomicrobia bacterium LW23]|nr:hypothetical protein DB346_14390 [Verrucomicrobia bacterium LW23]
MPTIAPACSLQMKDHVQQSRMVTPDLQRIRFGVNYVPSQKWWYCWNDFDPSEIAADFDAIAELGADHIRIMLVWPWFQPNRTWVSPAHLERLDVLMRLAATRRLDVCVAMLTGWLSGWAFRPTFDRPDTFYTAPEMAEPVELYFSACAGVLNAHANFLGFDLGNEMNCCWRAATTAQGDAFMERTLALAGRLSPQGVHVNGVDHCPWFFEGRTGTFSPGALATQHRIIPLHCWIEFTGARQRGGPRDRACTHLAPAMAALARAHAGDSRKPVWLQEFGASTKWMDADEIPVFLESAARAAVAGGIAWITWWCSHDILPHYQFDPLEYDLGLITTDNRLKPAGRAFQKLAAELRGKPVPAAPEIPLPPLPQTRTHEATWAWLAEVQNALP